MPHELKNPFRKPFKEFPKFIKDVMGPVQNPEIYKKVQPQFVTSYYIHTAIVAGNKFRTSQLGWITMGWI